MEGDKSYLGDGAYVEFDGQALKLTAENGIYVLETIVLGQDELLALIRFAEAKGFSVKP